MSTDTTTEPLPRDAPSWGIVVAELNALDERITAQVSAIRERIATALTDGSWWSDLTWDEDTLLQLSGTAARVQDRVYALSDSIRAYIADGGARSSIRRDNIENISETAQLIVSECDGLQSSLDQGDFQAFVRDTLSKAVGAAASVAKWLVQQGVNVAGTIGGGLLDGLLSALGPLGTVALVAVVVELVRPGTLKGLVT